MKIVLKTNQAKKLFETITNSISSEKNSVCQNMYCKNNGDGTMYVRAMDKSHVLQMNATVQESVDFEQLYIPFFEINKFLPKFKSDKISFEIVDDNVLKVSSGRSYCKTKIQTNVSEPQSVNEMLNEQLSVSFKIPKSVLNNVKNKLSCLVSSDNNRPVLTGVCLDIVNGAICFASSDGKKLSVYYTNESIDTTINKQIIIPVSTINTACSVVGNNEIQIGFSQRFVKFFNDDVKYYSNLTVGNYPPYQKIVSSTDKNDIIVTVNRSQLVDALAFVNVNFDITKKCQISISNNKFEIDYDCGANHQEFDVEYNGQFKFLVNSQFLQKMIKPLQSENIIFKFSTPTQAILMQSDNLKMILMPLKSNR